MNLQIRDQDLQVLKSWTGESIQGLQSDFFHMYLDDFKNQSFTTSETLVLMNTPNRYLVFEIESDLTPDFEDIWQITMNEKQTPSPLPYERCSGSAQATRSSGLSVFSDIESIIIYQKFIESFYFDYALVFTLKNGERFCMAGDTFRFWISFNQERIGEKLAGCSVRWKYEA
ncbi:hypothetical protein [Halobacillus trueperi]|uniref:hypothetical protein n=1 Tax=Halobacillus trueperi TaxID=156205 RepID=UPI003736C84C